MLLGFAAGALALNLLRPTDPWGFRAERYRRFERALDHLNLTPDPRAQINKIIRDSRAQVLALRKETQPRYKEIRMQTRERIRAVLTPSQAQEFQTLIKEQDFRRGSTAEVAP